MNHCQFQLLTYNIHKGFNVGNRRFVLHSIRKALNDVDADIMCLQEVQGQHLQHKLTVLNWPEPNQTEFIAQNVWQHHAYGKNALYSQGGHGNAIISKLCYRLTRGIVLSPL